MYSIIFFTLEVVFRKEKTQTKTSCCQTNTTISVRVCEVRMNQMSTDFLFNSVGGSSALQLFTNRKLQEWTYASSLQFKDKGTSLPNILGGQNQPTWIGLCLKSQDENLDTFEGFLFRF